MAGGKDARLSEGWLEWIRGGLCFYVVSWVTGS